MSYIKCKSILQGGKEVQVELTDFQISSESGDWGADNGSYMNLNRSPANNIQSAGSEYKNTHLTIPNVNGTRLKATYGNVENNSNNPIISAQVINVDNLELGDNDFPCYETEYVRVVLRVTKSSCSDLSVPGLKLLDGTTIDANNLKSKYYISKIIVVYEAVKLSKTFCAYNVIWDALGDSNANQQSITFITEFAVNTEMFRILSFNPGYSATWGGNRAISTYNNTETTNGMVYKDKVVNEVHDFVAPTMQILKTRGYSYGSNTTRAYSYEIKLVKEDGSDYTTLEKRKLNSRAAVTAKREGIANANGYLVDMADVSINWYYGTSTCRVSDYYTNYLIEQKVRAKVAQADEVLDISKSYYFKSWVYSTPILMAYDYDLNAYVSMADSIYEGSPEVPGEGDSDWGVPDWGDDTSPLDEADDPTTNWNPDNNQGYEPYPSGDVAENDWEPLTSWGDIPRTKNLYLFATYWKSTTEFQKQAMMEMIVRIVNTTSNVDFATVYKLVSGKPDISDIIERGFALPFEYSDITSLFNGHLVEETPVFNNIKVVGTFENETMEDVKYFDSINQRIRKVELGKVTIPRQFNNYLDFETEYSITLPYSNEKVNLDPNVLFKATDRATVRLAGWIDFETGNLMVKVIVNNSLYYQAVYSIAADFDIVANSNITVARTIVGLEAAVLALVAKTGLKAGTGTSSLSGLMSTLSSREIEKQLPMTESQRRAYELRERDINLRVQVEERQREMFEFNKSHWDEIKRMRGGNNE